MKASGSPGLGPSGPPGYIIGGPYCQAQAQAQAQGEGGDM